MRKSRDISPGLRLSAFLFSTMALTAGLALAAAPTGHAATPANVASAPLPSGQGVDLVTANCGGCHSLDNIRAQPKGKGAQFWKDEVQKMIVTDNAPILPDDADKIADYLGATFGK